MSSIMYNLERPILSEDEGSQIMSVCVEFTYYGAHKGYRDSLGCPEEPDEEAHVEVDSISIKDGTEVEVTETEMDDIVEACLKQVEKDL